MSDIYPFQSFLARPVTARTTALPGRDKVIELIEGFGTLNTVVGFLKYRVPVTSYRSVSATHHLYRGIPSVAKQKARFHSAKRNRGTLLR